MPAKVPKLEVINGIAHRECKTCKQLKLLTEFRWNGRRFLQTNSECLSCESNYYKNRNTYEHNKNNFLLGKYGITREKYDELYNAQEGKCKICEKHCEVLAVDHDHFNGNIRGLLCRNCNLGMGLLKDDISLLKKAIAYLQDSTHVMDS